MPTTAQQQQNLILLELGMNDDLGPVNSTSIAVLWEIYAEKALIAPRLQYLYTLRKAIDILTGQVANRVYLSTDFSPDSFDGRYIELGKLRANAQAEIDVVEARARAGRPVVVGTLTTTAPVTPGSPDPNTATQPDANGPIYEGSPYYPQRNRRGWV